MAGFLSDAERARLSRFPADVPHQDLVAYFTLSPADKRQVPSTAAAHNRLGDPVANVGISYDTCARRVGAASTHRPGRVRSDRESRILETSRALAGRQGFG